MLTERGWVVWLSLPHIIIIMHYYHIIVMMNMMLLGSLIIYDHGDESFFNKVKHVDRERLGGLALSSTHYEYKIVMMMNIALMG